MSNRKIEVKFKSGKTGLVYPHEANTLKEKGLLFKEEKQQVETKEEKAVIKTKELKRGPKPKNK